MKKILCLILAFMCTVAVSCADNCDTDSFGEKNGYNDKTDSTDALENIEDEASGNNWNENSLYPVKMFMADGHLWYDTGEDSKMTPRCGTLDGNIADICGEYELPKKDGCANFEVKDKNYFGWQNASEDTKEVPLDGGWRIFKRVDLLWNDISEFKGCIRVCGKEEYIMLTVNHIAYGKDYAAPKYIKPYGEDKDLIIPVKYGQVYDWGVVMSAENITPFGMTLRISTDKADLENYLGTGSDYTLDVYNGKFWERVPYNTSYENIAWDAVMYIIEGDTYSEDIDWEWLYGELPDGRYRISKSITNNDPGKRIWHSFYLEFEIKKELCSYPLVENTCPYALMHDGVMYYYTGEYIFDKVEYSDEDILGSVTSTIPETRMPSVDGQANIEIEGSIFMKHELAGDGLLVLIDGKWYIFEIRD